MSYVGELGWELHVPTEQLAQVYDAIWQRREEVDLVNAGHYAINSLRLEKGFCAWGADISTDETPREAGLDFATDLRKDFLGRSALEEQRKMPLRKRRLVFVLEDSGPVLWGGEPIWRDNAKVGYTTSGAYGHTVGAAVGMGYVPLVDGETLDSVMRSEFSIESSDQHYRAKLFRRGPYDPEGLRLRR